jgi:hypothetical protein
MAAEKTAGQEEPAPRPKHWDNMVRAAMMRVLGATQKEAAEAAGRSERTVRDWEGSPLWREALVEVEGLWLQDLKFAAMGTVLRNAAVNPMLGWDVLQRLVPALAPPRLRHEHTGKNGGPIQTESRFAEVPDADLFRGRDEALASALGVG